MHVAAAAEFGTYISDAEGIKRMQKTLTNYAAGMSGGGAVDKTKYVDYATQIGKALDGNMQGMKLKGFDLTDAEKQIMKVGSEMERVAVIEAMIERNWGGLSKAFLNTPTGKLQQMGNLFGNLKEKLGEKLSLPLMQLLDQLLDYFPVIESFFNGIGAAAVNAFSFISGAMDGVFGMIQTIKPLFVQFGETLSNKIQPILATLITLVTAFGVQSVMTGVRAAMAWFAAMWPLALITVAVVSLILIVHKLGASFEQIFKVIGGIIGWVVGIALGAVEFVWNLVSVFANFLFGVFRNPVAAIAKLFTGLANTVLIVLQKIANGIDAVFGTHLSDGIQKKIDFLNGRAKEFGSVKEIIPTLNLKNSTEFGKNFGGSLGKAIDGMDAKKLKNGALQGDFSGLKAPKLDEISSDTGKIAQNTSKISESLVWMREIAERDAIDRISNNSTNVNIQNENYFKNGMDSAGFMSDFLDQLRAAQQNNAPGVHA